MQNASSKSKSEFLAVICLNLLSVNLSVATFALRAFAEYLDQQVYCQDCHCGIVHGILFKEDFSGHYLSGDRLMVSVETFKYDEKIIRNISNWAYGNNWPVVYVFYNDAQAYVGETLDAVRRTEQHRMEAEFNTFTNICIISDKTFNKSVSGMFQNKTGKTHSS